MTIPKENMKPIQPFGLQITPENFDIKQLDRDELLALAREHKLVLFRGFAVLKKQELLNFCAKNIEKELLHWDFGPVMEMKVDPDPKNYLFSRECVPYHWDGAFHTVPSYLVFNCIEAPTTDCGGETLFCDTQRIWDHIDDAEKQAWRSVHLTYQTEKKAHYGGRVTTALVESHPHTQKTILRYAEEVETEMNPVTLEVTGTDNPEEFVANMQKFIYDDKFCYQHQWQNGDLLIVDNHAVIHGRNAFTQSCPRHLRRIQIL